MKVLKFRIAEFDEDGKFTGFLYLDASKEKFDSRWLNYNDPYVKIDLFTGLLDKLGKEIYEGDIIEYIYAGDEEVVEVKWTQWEEERSTGIGFQFTWFLNNGINIIGNIYEDSGLIKRV